VLWGRTNKCLPFISMDRAVMTSRYAKVTADEINEELLAFQLHSVFIRRSVKDKKNILAQSIMGRNAC
jgi:hypothetical protein